MKPKDNAPLRKASLYDLSNNDVIEAMKEIEGYIDISVQDFRELFAIAMRLARKRFLRSTPVGKIMQSDVVSISLKADLEQIISTLAYHSISGLPVVNDERIPVGVISEKDIFNKLSGEQGASFWGVLSGCLHQNGCLMKSITTVTAGDIMTSPAVTIEQTGSIREALELHKKKMINRLPVVDETGKLVGIVTRSDIIGAHLDYEDQ